MGKGKQILTNDHTSPSSSLPTGDRTRVYFAFSTPLDVLRQKEMSSTTSSNAVSAVSAGTLKSLNYRVDMITSSKDIENVNEPTAIVELHMTKSNDDSSVARFEMNKDELDGLLSEFSRIQQVIDKAKGGGK